MLDLTCQILALTDTACYNPDMDTVLAGAYAQQLLLPIKYGENGVFFWIPGSGMTTIVQTVFISKNILAKHLSGLAKNIQIISLWGHTVENKTSTGLLNYPLLERTANTALKAGKELICLLGRIDDYPDQEKLHLLRQLTRLNALNRRRIHIQFHSTNKPWFEHQLASHPELIALVNHMGIVPLATGATLLRYIKEMAGKYAFPLTEPKLLDICTTYGGLVQLTKEHLRSHAKNELLEIKLRANWQNLPVSYRMEIESKLLGNSHKTHSSAYRDLESFGFWNITAFSKYRSALNLDPLLLLTPLLTQPEQHLWKFLTANPNQTISKENLDNIIHPDNSDNLSLWALDQFVSRFRKKLLKSGIDPNQLETLKGKGYVWHKN